MAKVIKEAKGKIGYKQTKIGFIPKEWECEEIGDKIDLLSGFAFESENYAKEGIRLLRGANIKRGNTDWSPEITQFWNSKVNGLDRYILKDGDLVIAMDGSLVGRSYALLRKNDLPALLLQRIARIRSSKLHIGFLKEYIASPFFVGYCDSVKTVTAIPHISSRDIKKFKIAIPPFPEQQKIARILTTWDKGIEKTEQLIKKKQQLKKGLMQQLLTGKKRIPGFNPKWRKIKLENLGEFSKGSGISKSELVETGIPCVRYGEIYTTHEVLIKKFNSFIDKATASLSKKLAKGDILFAGSGETVEEIGKCVAFIGSEKAYVGGDIIIFRPNPQVDSLFLSYLLNSDDVNKQKSSMGKGHSVVHIYPSDLKKIEVKIPEVREQIIIGEILLKAGNEIELYKQRLSNFTYQKKGLMQKLLTGQVRVKT